MTAELAWISMDATQIGEWTVHLTRCLLHLSWIAALVGLAALGLDHVLRRARPTVRYRVSLGALILLAASLPASWWLASKSEAIVDGAHSLSAGQIRRENPANGEFSTGSRNSLDALRAGEQQPERNAARSAAQSAGGSLDHDHLRAHGQPSSAIDATTGTLVAERASRQKPGRPRTRLAAEPGKGASDWLHRIAPWASAAWLLGLLVMLGRLLNRLRGGHSLRRSAEPPDTALRDLLRTSCEHIGIAVPPNFGLSSDVTVPVLVGLFRPAILLPITLPTQLPREHIEAYLLHELCHLERHDLILDLAQRLLESVLFFHPLVWMLGRRVRFLRELSCDDLVVASGQCPTDYASVLVDAAELCLGQGTKRGTAVSGMHLVSDRPSELGARVLHLIGDRPTPRLRLSLPGLIAASLLAASSIAGLFLLGPLNLVRTDEPPPTENRGVAPTSISSATDPAEPEETLLASQGVPADHSDDRPAHSERHVLQGRILPLANGELPRGLRVQQRTAGSGYAERPKEVLVNVDGSFRVETRRQEPTVQLWVISDESAPWLGPRIPLDGDAADLVEIRLQARPTVRIQVVSTAGKKLVGGRATVRLRNLFHPTLGVFPLAEDASFEIPHCPSAPLEIDVTVPGHESLRTYTRLDASTVHRLEVRPAKVSRLRLVSAEDGKPIAGARLRLYSRRRADSALAARLWHDDGPIFGTSDAGGVALLTTLHTIDPRPTNDPGPAVYGFIVEAEGFARQVIGGVRAGLDLGEIPIERPLELSGTIEVGPNERVTVRGRWSQPTAHHEGAEGYGSGGTIEVAGTGKVPFRITGLRRGWLRAFLTIHRGEDSRQVQLSGRLEHSVRDLHLTRQGLTDDAKPGFTRASTSWIYDNVSPPTAEKLRETSMLVWATQLSMKFGGGSRQYKLFISEDGLLIAPEQGVRYRLSADEFATLRNWLTMESGFVDIEPESLERQPYDSFYSGTTSLMVVRDGTPTELQWSVAGSEGNSTLRAIQERLSREIAIAGCGGLDAARQFLEYGNRVLASALPDAAPFTIDEVGAGISTDGTRRIWLYSPNGGNNCRVTLIQPHGCDPHLERLERDGVLIDTRELDVRARSSKRALTPR